MWIKEEKKTHLRSNTTSIDSRIYIIIIIQGTKLATLSFQTTCISIYSVRILSKNIGLLQFHCNFFQISIMHRLYKCKLFFYWVIQQKNDARHDINLFFKKNKIILVIVKDVFLLQYVIIVGFGMLNSLLAYEI